MVQPVALVTGCSAGGIGPALVRELLEHGYRVFATARNTNNIEQSLVDAGAEVIALDVTNDESIQKAVQQISSKTGGTLNLLINNAGTGGQMVPLLDTDLAKAKAMADTNIWGVIAISQAFAPLLVNATNSKGDTRATIANVSSVWSIHGGAFRGSYVISKHAVKAICDVMRKEALCLGINVVEIITGGIQTQIVAKAMDLDKPAGSGLVYEQIREYYKPVMEGTRQKQVTDSIPVKDYAARVIPRLIKRKPPAHIYAGSHVWFFRYLIPFLPYWLTDRIMMTQQGLAKLLKKW